MTDQDMDYAQVSPAERNPINALLKRIMLKRKKTISPAQNEGFQTTGTLADSEAEM
jgi:hypothetical protein